MRIDIWLNGKYRSAKGEQTISLEKVAGVQWCTGARMLGGTEGDFIKIWLENDSSAYEAAKKVYMEEIKGSNFEKLFFAFNADISKGEIGDKGLGIYTKMAQQITIGS